MSKQSRYFLTESHKLGAGRILFAAALNSTSISLVHPTYRVLPRSYRSFLAIDDACVLCLQESPSAQIGCRCFSCASTTLLSDPPSYQLQTLPACARIGLFLLDFGEDGLLTSVKGPDARV